MRKKQHEKNVLDDITSLEQLKKKVADFTNDRDWNQYHSPKNLSMAIAVEAAELMEKFIWVDSAASFKEFEKHTKDIEYELVDVVFACIAFANACSIDISTAFKEKLALNCAKYPIEKVKGKWDKYTTYCTLRNDKK
jgi:NTP pyrophosphatase (non-canonical NTP hydrolase)